MKPFISGLVMVLLLGTVPAGAQEEDDDAGLNIVPLVNPDAPRLAVWFVAQPGIALEDASAVESQVFESLLNHRDVRLLGREAVQDKLSASGKEKLLQCRGQERCLLGIGRALAVERLVGVFMRREEGDYRIEIKSLLLQDQPLQLNSVVDGPLRELLVGGIDGAIAAIFENPDQYAPLVLDRPVPPRRTPQRKPTPAGERVASPPPPAPASKVANHVAAGNPAGSQPVSPPTATTVSAPADKTGISRTIPARPGFLRRHLGSTISLGAGVACLASGVALGVLGQQIADEQSRQYDPGRDSTGRSYTTAANVLFGLAGAAAATSVVLFLWVENDDANQAALTILPAPGGLQAAGRF